MIRVKKGRAPKSLAGLTSIGAKERKRAIAFFRLIKNREQTFAGFSAYKSPDVVASLNRTFAFKCAYCESVYAALQPVDIEHYRPKSAVDENGQLMRPGYYWLAATWSNLLPSCIDCNRRRYHDLPQAGRISRGKANLFPIANPSQRAKKPGQERFERRLLLNPCTDWPNRHLEFIQEGAVRAALIDGKPSPQGRSSIEVYGLDRPGLVLERHRWQIQIEGGLARLTKILKKLDVAKLPRSRRLELKTDLKEEMRQIKRYMQLDQPYAGMAVQIVTRFFAQYNID